MLLDGDDGECGDVGCGAEPEDNGEDDDKMIYDDDCDDGGGGDVGGAAEPEDNGEDDDKILSHCLELDKSGGRCWAGSDPEPRIWLKKYVTRHLRYLSMIIIIINSNVDILPICNIIGSCPFYVVGCHCLGGESQFSILSHDEMS